MRNLPVARARDRPADRDVLVPRTHRHVPAQDRPAVRRPRPHHGDARRAQDPLTHGRAPRDLQPGDRAHQPDQAAGPVRMTANTFRMSAKFAPHTMYAHRLWISMWMSLGHPEENHTHPGGNAVVTP